MIDNSDLEVANEKESTIDKTENKENDSQNVINDLDQQVEENHQENNKNDNYNKLFYNSLLFKFVHSPRVQKIKKFLYTIPGIYYAAVHSLFMVLIGIIVFFVTNKSFLCMTLLVISLDAFANVVFFDCPLSSLEKKYLNTSMIETRLQSIQKWGMMYANDKCYDTQLEVIINGWTLCAAKILILIIFDWFNINY